MTIYRRRLEFGMMNTVNRTMSDQELRSTVQKIHPTQPEVGETLFWGRPLGYEHNWIKLHYSLEYIIATDGHFQRCHSFGHST